MKYPVRFLFLLLLSITLWGCHPANTPPVPYRAVTQIDIVTQYDRTLIRRHYTAAEKMEAVLLYLRALKPTPKAVSLSQEDARDQFLIAVQLSDQSTQYYRQTNHRYFSKNGQRWVSIDPKQAAGLYALMRYFPSDP